jgi:hypothetical protein
MESIHHFLFPSKNGSPSEQKSILLQMIIVISSGILSSSAIATVLKAWIENRKTRLTIRIDTEGKTLTYEGHHLNQDAPTLHVLVEKVSQHPDLVLPVGTVIAPLRENEQKEKDVLKVSSHQENAMLDGSKQFMVRALPSPLKRLLPRWLSR